MGKSLLSSGDRDYDASDLDSALKNYDSAQKTFHDNGDFSFEGLAMLRLSYVHEQRLDLAEARDLAIRARDIFEENGEKALSNDARKRIDFLENRILGMS